MVKTFAGFAGSAARVHSGWRLVLDPLVSQAPIVPSCRTAYSRFPETTGEA